MESTTFFCKKKGQQVDHEICIARQNKGVCKCSQGKEIKDSKKVSRTRTKK